MLAKLLILTFATVLFLYWLRYICVLMLKRRTRHDVSERVAEANNLGYLKAWEHLAKDPPTEQLQVLHDWMARDYDVLRSLLAYTEVFRSRGRVMERSLLSVDFRLMQLGYQLTRRHAPLQARRALTEMSRILNHMANEIGERSETVART